MKKDNTYSKRIRGISEEKDIEISSSFHLLFLFLRCRLIVGKYAKNYIEKAMVLVGIING